MKKTIGILLMFMMTIMLAGAVSAASFVDPAAAGTMWGNYELNVSVTMANVENCTVTGTSALTSGTFTVTLYNQTVYTGAGNANGTVATASEIDASDWSLTGTCYNTSGTSEAITTRGSITIDNTAPVCTLTTTQESKGEYVPTDTWTATATRATGCTIKFGGNTYDMTESSDVCSFDTRIPEGLFDVSIYTTDGLNITYCTELIDVNIRYDDNAQVAGALLATGTVKKTTNGDQAEDKDLTPIFIIAAVFGVLWWINKNKNKKK